MSWIATSECVRLYQDRTSCDVGSGVSNTSLLSVDSSSSKAIKRALQSREVNVEGNYGHRPKMAKKKCNRPVVSRRPLSRRTRPPARSKPKPKALVVMEPKPIQVRRKVKPKVANPKALTDAFNRMRQRFDKILSVESEGNAQVQVLDLVF